MPKAYLRPIDRVASNRKSHAGRRSRPSLRETTSLSSSISVLSV
jgi:hypothetical protein